MAIEENFQKLEILLEQLEAEDVTLEQSFKAYEEGMKLLKQCNKEIDKVEKKVLQISESGDLVEF